MDDKQAKNSWDDLLQDLGAKPDESAFERHQAADQDIPPTVEWAEAEETVEETEASPGDWNSLAESLGLEVEESPEPVEEPVVAEDATPAVDKVEERVAKKGVEEVEATEEPFGGFAAPEDSSFEEVTDDDSDDDAYDEADDFDEEEAADTSDDELPPLPSPMEQALSETAWDEDSEEEKSEAAADDDDEDDDSSGISGEAARSAFDALFSDGSVRLG